MVEGVRTDDWVQVVTHRTRDKFASFSWTNRIMGMVVPIGPGHEGEPDFIVPIVNGFVGGFDPNLGGKKSAPTFLEHSWTKTATGFETSGILLLNNGRLKQKLTMTSIGDKTVVYQDRVTALTNITIAAELGVPIGIENDDVTGGKRLLTFENGQAEFDQQKPKAGDGHSRQLGQCGRTIGNGRRGRVRDELQSGQRIFAGHFGLCGSALRFPFEASETI